METSKSNKNGYSEITNADLNLGNCAVTTLPQSYECLKFLHENGCKLFSESCERAAKFGNLKVLKYLHETDVK